MSHCRGHTTPRNIFSITPFPLSHQIIYELWIPVTPYKISITGVSVIRAANEIIRVLLRSHLKKSSFEIR